MTLNRVQHYNTAEDLLERVEAADVPAAGPKRAEALRDQNALLMKALVHATLATLPA